jgi:hypothetical protein
LLFAAHRGRDRDSAVAPRCESEGDRHCGGAGMGPRGQARLIAGQRVPMIGAVWRGAYPTTSHRLRDAVISAASPRPFHYGTEISCGEVRAETNLGPA